MKKKEIEKKSYSIKMLVIYGIVVFAAIIIALFVRVVSVINASKFDGQHRFTLAFGSERMVSGLMSFEPSTSSLSLLTFSNKKEMPHSALSRTVGVMPDGYIKANYNFVISETIPSILQSFILHFNNISRNITFYDLLQFWIYSNKIPVSTISYMEIPIFSDPKVYNKTSALLFTDSVIISENVSIQVINATGESGMGGRLERVITNLGGNVVSVETAKTIEARSKIQYFGSETYTLKKLGTLLQYRNEKLKKQAIAEIIIIIGEDNKNTEIF